MPQNQHPWLRRHQVAVFLIGSVALGWLATLAVAGLSSSAALLPLLAIAVSYVPAVMALLVLRFAGTAEECAAFRARTTRVRTGRSSGRRSARQPPQPSPRTLDPDLAQLADAPHSDACHARGTSSPVRFVPTLTPAR